MKTDWAITLKGKAVEIEIRLPDRHVFTRITPKVKKKRGRGIKRRKRK